MKKRLYYLDNVKILMAIVIISVHTALPYTPIWWFFKSYSESPELLMYYQVLSTIAVGMFFLISAYFIPMSYDRRGEKAFIKERFKIYLIPIILGLFFVILPSHYFYHLNFRHNGYNEFFNYVKNVFFGINGKPEGWSDTWLNIWPDLKFAHLWFLEHLLMYSLIYVLIKKIRKKLNIKGKEDRPCPTVSLILICVIILSIITFITRIWFPLDYWGGFLGFIQVEYANLPKYIAFIFIGILSYRNQWFSKISKSQGIKWLIVGVSLLVAAFIGKGKFDFIVAMGGLNVESFIWSVWDCLMCMSLNIGVIVLFRESFNITSSLLKVLSENTFGVYIFHVPVLALVQFALRDVGTKAPILVRFLFELVLGVIASFVTVYIIRSVYYALKNTIKLGALSSMKNLKGNENNNVSIGSKDKKLPIFNKKILAVVLAAVVAAGGIKLSSSLLASPGLAQDKYTVLQSGKSIKKINAKGEVKSESTFNVYSDAELLIKEVKVDVGDKVKANDVLAILDTDKLRDKIEELEASLLTTNSANKVALDEARAEYEELMSKTTAETNSEIKNAETQLNQAKLDYDSKMDLYEKYKVLYSNGSITEQELSDRKLACDNAAEILNKCTVILNDINNSIQRNLDKARNNYNSLKIKYEDRSQRIIIDNMKKDLNKAVITAPVDGIITVKNASEGNASSGVLFEIKDDNDITVNVNVKEVDIEKIKEGQMAEIKSDSIGTDVISGQVISIQPIANASDKGALDLSSDSDDEEAEFEVKIRMNDTEHKLKIGMKAQADIIIDDEIKKQESYVIPVESIIKDKDDNDCVYIAEKREKDYVVKEIQVTKGTEDDINAEIYGKDLNDNIIVLNNPSDYEIGDIVTIK